MQIPLPVTTGLFLYLGVTGLKGNEMWERTKLLITDGKLRPKVYSFVYLYSLGPLTTKSDYSESEHSGRERAGADSLR